MKANLISFSLFLLVTCVFASCGKDECEEFYQDDCITTQEYAPVCGCNEKTYANKSYAECAQVDYTEGACQ